MSEIVNKESLSIVSFFKSLDCMLERIQSLANHRPPLGGEHYLSDKEVSTILKVSRRTLQDWRTNGQIAYIALGGKTLYRESDIQAMLERNHRKAIE